jgi:hypothetical protein
MSGIDPNVLPPGTSVNQPEPPSEPASERPAPDVAEIIARIESKVPRWRAWFLSEWSHVEIPRCELLALVEAAKQTLKETP